MNAKDELKEAFKGYVSGRLTPQLRWVKCIQVNWEERTMDGVGVSDDTEYYDVQLGGGSFDVKPALDSTCLIGVLEGNESDAFLLSASQAEEISIRSGVLICMNEGKLGGLVKLKELTDSLNSLKKYCETLKSAVSAGLSAVGESTAASGSKAVLEFTDKMNATIEIGDLENKKIKQ